MSTKSGIWLGVGAVALYLIIGWFSLTSGSLNVQAQNGVVWNQIDVSGQKLARLEAQYAAGGIQLPKDLAAQIIEGRKALASAKSANDLDAATKAASGLQINLVALTEANAILDTTKSLTALMDETSEAFNKIGYERGKLIEAQKGYAFSRSLFFPLAGSFPVYGILGANANPAQPMPTSQFAPTPIPQ